MNIIEEFNKLVISISRDESLSALLRGVVDKQSISKSSSKKYYTVTQLINPQETYYSKMHPKVKIPSALGRKLAQGTQLHNFASSWFINLPGFEVDEGI